MELSLYAHPGDICRERRKEMYISTCKRQPTHHSTRLKRQSISHRVPKTEIGLHTVVNEAASVASSGERHAGEANDTAETLPIPEFRSRKVSKTATARQNFHCICMQMSCYATHADDENRPHVRQHTYMAVMPNTACGLYVTYLLPIHSGATLFVMPRPTHLQRPGCVHSRLCDTRGSLSAVPPALATMLPSCSAQQGAPRMAHSMAMDNCKSQHPLLATDNSTVTSHTTRSEFPQTEENWECKRELSPLVRENRLSQIRSYTRRFLGRV